jgi:hypothetical protein
MITIVSVLIGYRFPYSNETQKGAKEYGTS